MKKILFSFFIIIFLSSFTSAQKLSVIETVKITDKSQGEFYFPKLSPDGSKVFFTSAGYKGLWYYDIKDKKVVSFSSEPGAGYEFAFSGDGKSVYYRVDNFGKDGLRASQTMVQKNISTKQRQVLETANELSSPRILLSNKLAYTSNDRLVVKASGSSLGKSSTQQNVKDAVVYIENQDLVLYSNGNKKILTPLGKGNYIWPSLSPDGTKILFTLAGKGTFVSDLDGKILMKLGYANAPKWSPDGRWVIYMVDRDNGLEVTESDIFAVSADGSQKTQLNVAGGEAAMYPEWSSDGQSVVYHSDEGSIYLMKLSND